MKKYLYAGLLSACLAAPAFAATNKAPARDEPLRRRAILLCMGVLVAYQTYKFRPRLPARYCATYDA
jgi:hypothetical protein